MSVKFRSHVLLGKGPALCEPLLLDVGGAAGSDRRDDVGEVGRANDAEEPERRIRIDKNCVYPNRPPPPTGSLKKNTLTFPSVTLRRASQGQHGKLTLLRHRSGDHIRFAMSLPSGGRHVQIYHLVGHLLGLETSLRRRLFGFCTLLWACVMHRIQKRSKRNAPQYVLTGLPKKSPIMLDVCAAKPLRSDPMDVRNSCVCDIVDVVDKLELDLTRRR